MCKGDVGEGSKRQIFRVLTTLNWSLLNTPMIPTQKGGGNLPSGDEFQVYMDKLMEKVKAIRRELAKKISFKSSPTKVTAVDRF